VRNKKRASLRIVRFGRNSLTFGLGINSIQEFRKLPQILQVNIEQLPQKLPLDLHRKRQPALRCHVHLSQARGCQ